MNNHPSSRHNCKACPVEQVRGMMFKLYQVAEFKTGNHPAAHRSGMGVCRKKRGKEQIYAGSNTPDDFAWYRENSAAAIHSIKKLPNGLGIYNMSGNAWEWCLDFYNENYYQTSPLNNPQGPETGKNRVIRGGGYLSSENECRVTHRNNADPKERKGSLGFRLLLSSSPARPTGQARQSHLKTAAHCLKHIISGPTKVEITLIRPGN